MCCNLQMLELILFIFFCKKMKLCTHKKSKYNCKFCGTGFCIHNRYKNRCRDCGTGICIHDKWNSQCNICKKNRPSKKKYCVRKNSVIGFFVENICKDCKTSTYKKIVASNTCKHGKYVCKLCEKGYCIHERSKYKCKDCGTGYCKHKKIKQRCKDCGTGHCEHGRIKYTCKDCDLKWIDFL